MGAVEAQLTPLERRRWSRSDQFGVVAAQEALEDAGLLTDACDRLRVGVLLGAGTADLLRNEAYQHTTLFRGIQYARPSQAWNHFSSTPVDVIASRFGFGGLRSCVVAACSSSTIAISQAADAIRMGRLDAALAGGTDAIARLTFSGFNALRLMDPEPCRPFDRDRAGMNIGEGAAILVLEEMDARAGARRDDLRRAGRVELLVRGVSSNGAGAGREAGGRRRAQRATRRRRTAGGGGPRQRARHRDASERSRRDPRLSGAVRRPREPGSR